MRNTPKSAFRAIFPYIEKRGDDRGTTLTPLKRVFPLSNRRILPFLRLSATLLIFCIIPLTYAEEIRWEKLVESVIVCESGGDPSAVSSKGCIGLMQISKICLKEYNKGFWNYHMVDPKENSGIAIKNMPYELKDLYNPKINRKIGSWYLRELHFRYKCETTEQILMAYNAGITRCKRVNFDIKKLPRETQAYVKRVMKIYERTSIK